MSHRSILKSTMSLNTMSISEKKMHLLLCTRTQVELTVSNSRTQTEFEPLNFCFCEPESNLNPIIQSIFNFNRKPAKSNDEKPELEVNRYK